MIKGGIINDAVHREAYTADIAVKDGKIVAIAENIGNWDDENVIDAKGKYIYPGLVEAHCHIGLNNYGTGPVGKDENEKSDIITPHLRAVDAFYPADKGIEKALRGGITTVCTGPGSTNIVGGTFLIAKTVGTCVDDMLIKQTAAMKCAFGENPKHYGEKADCTRMQTAAKLRELLFLSKEYYESKLAADGDRSKMPKFNMKYEAMIPVLKKEIPLKAHAHRSDDIMTAVRIAKEFGLDLTLEHCTEGHLIVNELVRAGYPVAIGPSFSAASKVELAEKSSATAGILSKAGLSVSIITDAPVTPTENLPVYAGLCVKAGMDRFDALKAITINAAKHIGAADRVGSLEVGKDADILITDGDILSNLTNILTVIVDGRIAVNN